MKDYAYTQIEHYYKSRKYLSDANHAFLSMVNDPINPMTMGDLRRLIERRPAVYSRFSSFLKNVADDVLVRESYLPKSNP